MRLIAWLSGGLAAVDAVLAGGKAGPADGHFNPVLLVHGIYSCSRDMRRLAGHLRATGRTVYLIDLHPNCGRAGIDELAGQVAAFAERNIPPGKFDVVGFSMGGLVSRYYVQRLGGADRVEHLVTLAAPHRGTVMAILNRTAGGSQMRRASAFLADLERDDEALRRVKFTSVYTPLDLMILPARSSELPQARNVRIWALLHPSLILEKRCLRAVAAALEPGEGETRILKPETRIKSQRTYAVDKTPPNMLREKWLVRHILAQCAVGVSSGAQVRIPMTKARMKRVPNRAPFHSDIRSFRH